MADIVLPASLRWARSRVDYVDQTGVARGWGNGFSQTTATGGDRVRASIDFTPHGGGSAIGKADLAILQSTLFALKGKQNRIWVTDAAYRFRGSFPTAELFSNSDFASGTAGWAAASGGVLTDNDGTAKLSISTVGANADFRQSVTLSQYAPYVIRSLILDGERSQGLSIGPSLEDVAAAVTANAYSTTRGYRVATLVPITGGSGTGFPAVFATTSGYIAGAYVRVPFCSVSRCFLADGGGTLTTRSREIDNAAWTKTEITVTSTAETAPDGTTTAEALTPSTNNGVHLASQALTVTSSAQDINIRGCFKGNGYNFVLLALTEGTGATQSYVMFNLGTGAVGATQVTGANWSSRRAAIEPLGNGWYYCSIVVRKTNAATSVTAQAYAYSADSAANYAGNGTSGIRVWEVNASPSEVHARTVTSTSAAVAAESQSGTAILVKGLPASTLGLLLVGDWVEIDGQLKMVTAPLDSNAAGLGHLQFAPALFRAIADNTPIIVHRPMGRFLFAGDSIGFDNEPGVISRAVLELEQASPP
jgi:hypothetical protein